VNVCACACVCVSSVCYVCVWWGGGTRHGAWVTPLYPGTRSGKRQREREREIESARVCVCVGEQSMCRQWKSARARATRPGVRANV